MKIKINGVELTYNIYEAEQAERFENEVTKMAEVDKKVNKAQKLSSKIRTQCKAIFNFFDVLFGDGTADAVFGETCDLMQAMTAYTKVIKAITEDKQIMRSLKKELESVAAEEPEPQND